MSSLSKSRFEIRGCFSAFVRNGEGKRRMQVRLDSGELCELKIAKDLRKQSEAALSPNAEIIVAGIEERCLWKEAVRVVTQIRVLSGGSGHAPACRVCPIRICAKKNCWNAGGKELFLHAQRRIEEYGLAGVVEVKAVDCLDECKRRPNLMSSGKVHSRCTISTVEEMVNDIAEGLNAVGGQNAVRVR